MSQKKGKLQTISKGELIISRILLIISGLICLVIGVAFYIVLPLAVLCFYLAYLCKKELKRRKNEVVTVESVKEIKPKEVVRETVMVTDVDGSINEVSIHLVLDQKDRVLVAEGGKSYHTHLNCFKKWRPEMTENFTGWKIVKKSEALSKNMKYCSFCKELDCYNDDNLDELEEYED